METVEADVDGVRGRMWVKIRFMVKTGKMGAHTGSVTLMIRRDMLGL